MKIEKLDGLDIFQINSNTVLMTDVQSTLDFAMIVFSETNINKFIVKKDIFSENFFDLKTKKLGDSFQKLFTYGFKLVVVENFLNYKNKSLSDFIKEANRGNDFAFLSSREEAIIFFTLFI